jgi:hypothetical protein
MEEQGRTDGLVSSYESLLASPAFRTYVLEDVMWQHGSLTGTGCAKYDHPMLRLGRAHCRLTNSLPVNASTPVSVALAASFTGSCHPHHLLTPRPHKGHVSSFLTLRHHKHEAYTVVGRTMSISSDWHGLRKTNVKKLGLC